MADVTAVTAPRWRTVVACGLAATATVAVFLLRPYLPAGLGERPLLTLFMLPVLASALLDGFVPCAVALAVAVLLTSGLMLKAGAGAQSGDAADLLQWSVLVACGVLASAAHAVLQRVAAP